MTDKNKEALDALEILDDIRVKADRELALRGGTDAWSEEIEQ